MLTYDCGALLYSVIIFYFVSFRFAMANNTYISRRQKTTQHQNDPSRFLASDKHPYRRRRDHHTSWHGFGPYPSFFAPFQRYSYDLQSLPRLVSFQPVFALMRTWMCAKRPEYKLNALRPGHLFRKKGPFKIRHQTLCREMYMHKDGRVINDQLQCFSFYGCRAPGN